MDSASAVGFGIVVVEVAAVLGITTMDMCSTGLLKGRADASESLWEREFRNEILRKCRDRTTELRGYTTVGKKSRLNFKTGSSCDTSTLAKLTLAYCIPRAKTEIHSSLVTLARLDRRRNSRNEENCRKQRRAYSIIRIFSDSLILRRPTPRMAPHALLLAVLASLVVSAHAAGLVDEPFLGDAAQYLDGGAWTALSSKGMQINASVPGDLITDLQRAGVIGDPLYELVWIENASLWDEADWTYTRIFSLANAAWLSTSSEIYLVFDGVKMSADISLNGQLLGSVFDQFGRYTYPVKSILKVRPHGSQLRRAGH